MATITGDNGSNVIDGTDDADVIDGKAGDDTIKAYGGDDLLISGTGYDILLGGAGDDQLYFGADFSNADYADGGSGFDTLILQGNYASRPVFGRGILWNMEQIRLLSGTDTSFGDLSGRRYSYSLKLSDANVGGGQVITVDGRGLRAGENLTFDGSAETDGSFVVLGGRVTTRSSQVRETTC